VTHLKDGSLKILESSGPLQACTGFSLPFHHIPLFLDSIYFVFHTIAPTDFHHHISKLPRQ